MGTALWIVQILLALAFLMAGGMKLMHSKGELASNMAWVEDFTQQQIRGIGLLEVLGAIGLVLPAATGILTVLTPLAALGLALTMIGAALTHLRRGETPMIIPNVVLFLLAAFVVYGRFIAAPFT